MRLLLDTHILIWMAQEPHKLTAAHRTLLSDRENEVFFSPVSLWEIGVKRKLERKRPDFDMDPYLLRQESIANGFGELPVLGEHALAVNHLEDLHQDPFDRLLICQASVEGLTLMTRDSEILQYSGVATLRA